jgi:RNA polymerase II subunit A small phosphatase-like protein
MITDRCIHYIPPQRVEDHGKVVVVLDLDESLIYGRDGPIVMRPGLRRFLATLHSRCEVVLWTAGQQDYALEAIGTIDPTGCIQHCVYRHPKWWTGEVGYAKDLRALGRSLRRTVLIDNTPDCHKANPENGILVTDYGGDNGSDNTLLMLSDIFEDLLNTEIWVDDVTAWLSSDRRLVRRAVPCDGGGSVVVHTLCCDSHLHSRIDTRKQRYGFSV